MASKRTAAFAFLLLTAAAQGQKFDDALAAAVAAAQTNDVKAAAKAFGVAAALAHKSNDLLAEQCVAESLWPFLQTLGAADLGDALALVASALDPKRAGAFVSAPAIAGELLMLATRDGGTAHVAEAAAILKAQSGASKSGKAMRTLIAYARGLDLVAAKKIPESFSQLEDALKGAVAEGWTDVALHVGTEIAARAAAAGNAQKSAAALSMVGSLFKTDTDADLVQTWRKLVGERLKDAPAEILAPFNEAMKPFSGRNTVSAAGGTGGAGGRGDDVSALGAAWKSLSPTQSFVSVKRIDDGFELSAPFDPPLKLKQPLKPGVTHAGEGGLTLSFRGRGVALRMLDLTGLAGGPGDTIFLPPGIPLYRLARGETWAVSRQGAVSISG